MPGLSKSTRRFPATETFHLGKLGETGYMSLSFQPSR